MGSYTVTKYISWNSSPVTTHFGGNLIHRRRRETSKDGEASWISSNRLLQHHSDLTSEVVDIFNSVPDWFRQCAVHVRQDPVLDRCSWEEQRSICIRFKQTHNTDSGTIEKYGGETQNEGWTGGSVRHKNWWRSG